MAKDSKRREVVTQPNLFSRHVSKGNRLSFQNPKEIDETAEEGPLTVGAQLRAAREAKELSLHQVADILRLRASQVHALEEGDFNSLPGQTFVTGFLRSYANLLDLDAVAIVELYKHEEGDGLHVPSLAFPEPTSGGRIPGAGILLGTFVVALILLAGWFVYQESETLDFERVAELPDHLASKIRDLQSSESENLIANTESESVLPVKNVAEISPAKPEITEDESKIEPSDTTAEKEQATMGVADSTSSTPMAEEENSLDVVTDPASSRDEGLETEVAKTVETENTSVATAGDEATSGSEVTNIENPQTTDTVEASTSASNEESQTAATTPKVEDEAAPAVTEQATDTVTSYPQDTLETASVMQSTAVESQESPLPRTFGVENTDARVVVRATEESWVEVKAADEKPVLSRVLKPGDVYMAPNAPNLKLTTGNAGGLKIRVDGKEIKSLGGTGTILREVPLAAESLLENNGLQ